MPDDVTAGLVRSLVESLQRPTAPDDWESCAMVLEFGDGFRSVSGYVYRTGGAAEPVASSWQSIQPAVETYLASRYEPDDTLPVQMLVQLERSSGRSQVLVEETDEGRWEARPYRFEAIAEELRPRFA